jgi:hypothetical protein
MIERKQEEATAVPMPAVMLGAAGLLPLVLALLVRIAAGIYPATPLPALIGSFALIYAALILSFLGGIWWGIAATRVPPERMAPLLVLSVLPSLAALAILGLMFAAPVPASILLGLVIMVSPLVDRRLQAQGLAPAWWMRLRLPLSLGLGALTIALGLSLG